MSDQWHIYAANIEDRTAWISFNASHAQRAESDNRDHVLKVRVALKEPTSDGMPGSEEFPALLELDRALEDYVAAMGGVFVGRLTHDGCRYFYYYASAPGAAVELRLRELGETHGYTLKYLYQSDPGHRRYHDELYPTPDDWVVVRDLETLSRLREAGDDARVDRRIDHWAYFATGDEADAFARWAGGSGFSGAQVDQDDDRWRVRYHHIGTVRLADITTYTIRSERRARELNGEYDGWESSVEKG